MPETEMRDGTTVTDPRLGRLYEEDWNSLRYPIRTLIAPTARPRSYTWSSPVVLDQGQEGSCVGHGWAHELLARPVPADPALVDHRYAKEQIYWGAQHADEWDGGAYPGASPFMEGTSVLAAAKVCQALGWIGEYRWALNLEDIVLAAGYKGPVVIGVDWWSDMFRPDANGYIHPTGTVEGGHCVAIVAVKVFFTNGVLDEDRSYFTILNSWGAGWGNNGRAKISLREFRTLIPGGDFCIPSMRKQAA